MDSIHFIFLLLTLTLSQNPQEQNTQDVVKRAKIKGCMNLVRAKLNRDYETIQQIVEHSAIDQEQTVNKIVSDMLVNCYSQIKDDNAKEISSQEVDAISVEQYDSILYFDQKQFKTENAWQMTPQQQLLYKEVMAEVEKFKQEESEKQKQEEGVLFSPPNSWSNMNKILMCLTVLVILSGAFYFLVQKIQQESSYKQAKKKTKGKKKRGE